MSIRKSPQQDESPAGNTHEGKRLPWETSIRGGGTVFFTQSHLRLVRRLLFARGLLAGTLLRVPFLALIFDWSVGVIFDIGSAERRRGRRPFLLSAASRAAPASVQCISWDLFS